MKKLNLRILMYVQTVIALCIPLYYHFMVTYKISSSIPFIISVVLLLVVGILKKSSETKDEYAKEALKVADSICFKISIVIMGIVILPFIFLEGEPMFLVGYLLTFGVFVLIFIRTCIFCWIDKKGME